MTAKQSKDVKIHKTHILEWITFALLFIALGYAVFSYTALPDQIPETFFRTLDGKGSKNWIWLPLIVSSLICYGLYRLNRHPELLNYPSKMQKPFRKKAYKLSRELIRVFSLLIAILALALTVFTVEAGKGDYRGTTDWILHIFGISFIVLLVIYVSRALLLPGKS